MLVKSESFHNYRQNYKLKSCFAGRQPDVPPFWTLDEWPEVESFLSSDLLPESSINTNYRFYKEINFFLKPSCETAPSRGLKVV